MILEKLNELLVEVKTLDVPDKHRKKIAIDTLKMSDSGAKIAGGMTKDEARKFLKSIGYSDDKIKKLEESIVEKEKWAKDVKVKKGKMHKLLNIPDDKEVSDVYTSGEKLAKALMAKVKNEKEVTGMLAYPANTNPKDNVFDKALRYMKKIGEDKKEK